MQIALCRQRKTLVDYLTYLEWICLKQGNVLFLICLDPILSDNHFRSLVFVRQTLHQTLCHCDLCSDFFCFHSICNRSVSFLEQIFSRRQVCLVVLIPFLQVLVIFQLPLSVLTGFFLSFSSITFLFFFLLSALILPLLFFKSSFIRAGCNSCTRQREFLGELHLLTWKYTSF